ncbi:hypothetical protein [Paenibacillus soyae]|uniref:Multi-tm2 domain protein n=1 Tax=Paenibacillus soyae TaxID=2969249 RepID=A0A9X2MNN0_9BACL|nr:hypothetical protein [Paenibacillus soyae]MCR2805288.1 hypothetical protein [Paenibacillus soyae]
MIRKSPLTAFFLSFIPGAGHAYLGRTGRLVMYGGGFFGSLLLAAFALATDSDEIGAFMLVMAFLFGFVNMLDMIITIISGKAFAPAMPGGYPPPANYEAAAGGGLAEPYGASDPQQGAAFGSARAHYASPAYHEQQQEKTRTILLSIIPGLGHMNLGLLQRGITFLVSFVGLFAIIVFISIITNSASMLVFLLALPVIWIYGIFDASSLVTSKHNGALLEDRSLFEGIESHIASGQKNKVLTIALSIFPGAGHLYLGLQKRGLQLMGGFLLAIYIMDNLRLSLFLFLLPLFWCFAFFDALAQLSRYGRQRLSDEPVLPMFVPYQRWLGVGLLGFGVYFLVDRILIRELLDYFPHIYAQYMEYKYMLPTVIIAFVMIVIGLRLAFGRSSVLSAGPLERGYDSRADEEGRP